MAASYDLLPEEMWVQILSFLPSSDFLDKGIIYVCKRWFNIIKNYCKLSIYSRFNQFRKEKFIYEGKLNFNTFMIESLWFSCYGSSNLLQKLSNSSKIIENLTFLNVNRDVNLDEQVQYIGKLTNLKTLRINTVMRDTAVHLKSLTNLTELQIHSGLDAEDVEHLSELSNLTKLDITHNYISDRGIKCLSEKFKNLTYLSLDMICCAITSEEMKYVSELQKLKTLKVEEIGMDSEGAKYLSELKQLTQLDISRNRLGSKGAKYLSELTNLTSLNIEENEILSQGATYLSNLKKLQYLNLKKNRIDGNGVKKLNSLINLRTLDISYNPIGNEGAKMISELINLEWLIVDKHCTSDDEDEDDYEGSDDEMEDM